MFKMFVTVFLILSISMLTQSAPAADPAPCAQEIEIPVLDCAPVFISTTGQYEEECITRFRVESFPCFGKTN